MQDDLIAGIVGDGTNLYTMVTHRLAEYIRVNEEDLLELSYFRLDKPLVEEELKTLLLGRIPSSLSYRSFPSLSYFVANEIFMDLYTSYKQEDSRFKGRLISKNFFV